MQATEEGVSSATLKKLSLPYIPYKKCIAFVPDEYKDYITLDKLCAGFSNNTDGVCKGDSGGGLSFKDNDTNKYFIYGIDSNTLPFNETHCYPRMYSLYTNVMDHIEMIKEKYLSSTKILRNLLENPKTTGKDY